MDVELEATRLDTPQVLSWFKPDSKPLAVQPLPSIIPDAHDNLRVLVLE